MINIIYKLTNLYLKLINLTSKKNGHFAKRLKKYLLSQTVKKKKSFTTNTLRLVKYQERAKPASPVVIC